jgi:hypothetical protein
VGPQGPVGPQGQAGAAGPNVIVAGGRFSLPAAATAGGVTTVFSFNKLSATPFQASKTVFILRFSGFKTNGLYVVKGTPITQTTLPVHTFEVIQLPDPNMSAFVPVDGIPVKVTGADGQNAALGFMVEISEFPNLG